LSHLFSRIRHLPVSAYSDKQSTVKQVNGWITFYKSNSKPLTLDGSPFGAERVPVPLAHAPPLYTRLRQEEGVGVQLLWLQSLSGHLQVQRIRKCWGTASLAPAPPWPPVPRQRVRRCWGTASLAPAPPWPPVPRQNVRWCQVQLVRLRPCTSTEG
jgi:hypothetical protein